MKSSEMTLVLLKSSPAPTKDILRCSEVGSGQGGEDPSDPAQQVCVHMCGFYLFLSCYLQMFSSHLSIDYDVLVTGQPI